MKENKQRWDGRRIATTALTAVLAIYFLFIFIRKCRTGLFFALPAAPAGTTHQHGLDWYWSIQPTIPWNPATRRLDPHWTRWCKRDRVWLDVGAHMRAFTPGWFEGAHYVQGPIDSGTPPALPGDWFGTTQIFAFEPQLQFWHSLKAQSSCVFPINAAVGDANAPTSFGVTGVAHSSSLLDSDPEGLKQLRHLENYARNEDGSIDKSATQASMDWTSGVATAEHTSVMVVSLEDVIPRLVTCRVELLKVDAQGFDLKVVQSAKNWIKVVDVLMIESPSPGSVSMYQGGALYEDIVGYMESVGFTLRASSVSCCSDKQVLEKNLYFENNSREWAIGAACPTGGPATGECRLEPLATCQGR